MGIYADHIFPRIMEAGLGGGYHRGLRTAALAGARGRVIEIGFGTGLNLPCYPAAVEQLVGVDSGRALERVCRRIANAGFPVERLERDAADRLPFDDDSFDTAVSTWTLCSIDRVGDALSELRRVLRRGGRFLFMEHGRSDRRISAALQDALNPVQNVVGVGCNLNRRIDREIEAAGFRIERLERFRIENVPRVFGEVYRGCAAP